MTVHTLMSPGGATVAKQDDILVALAAVLTELGQKLEAGQAIELGAATQAALESIQANVTGTVALDAPSLAALENVTATIANLPDDFPDDALLAKVEAVRALLAAPLAVTGPLTDGELRADDVDVADSGERLYTHVTATVTASGDTTVHPPASGKRIRLRWIYAINDPSDASPPLIRVRLGATEIYRVWALSKRQLVLGAVDAPLIINLDDTGKVAFTALLEEI